MFTSWFLRSSFALAVVAATLAPHTADAAVLTELDKFNSTGTGVVGVTRDADDFNNGLITGGFLNYTAISGTSDPTDSFVWSIDQSSSNAAVREWGAISPTRAFDLVFLDETTDDPAQLLTVLGDSPVDFSWTITDANGSTLEYDATLSNLDRLRFSSSNFSLTSGSSFDYDAVEKVGLEIDSNVGSATGDNLFATFNGGRLAVTAVPEPFRFGFLSVTGLGMACVRRCRSRARAV
jgi:hypothetical protein